MRLLARPAVVLTTLTNVTEAERSAALRQRETRRAFDGARPVGQSAHNPNFVGVREAREIGLG